MQHLRFSRLLFTISLIIIYSIHCGCSPKRPPLRVATNLWPGYEMIYLANNLGYYKDCNIRLIEVPTTSQVTRNLRSGNLEAGCLTLDESLTLLQDKIKIRVIVVLDESCGGDVIMAKPGIENLQALKGKRVGVENSTVSAVLLDAALRKVGMSAVDIIQVPMSVDQHFKEYQSGSVDVLATYEPVRSQVLKVGGKILFSSAQIPGRILDVLVVRTEIMDRYEEELRSLVRGIFLAQQYLHDHPQESAKLMSKRLGEDPLSQFLGIHVPDLVENHQYLAGDSARLYKTAGSLMQLMLDHNLLRKTCSFSRFAEPKYLPEVGQ